MQLVTTSTTTTLTHRLSWCGVLLVVVALVGCGDKKDPPPKPTETPDANTKKSAATKPTAKPKSSGKAATSESGGWGTLRGRFVVDGDVPKPTEFAVGGAAAAVCCAGGCPVDDSLIVAEDGGLANVIVYLRLAKGQKVAIHESYEKDRDKTVVMDNTKCMFSPHVVLMRTSQTLSLKNSDPVGHNTNVQPIKNQGGSILIAPGTDTKRTFDKPETIPAMVVCNIHPWMNGYVLPRDNPYFALTSADGSFAIKNLPAGGTLEFQLWHERPGYLRDVDVNGKTAKRGRVKIKIEPGDNDLGDINVPAGLLKRE